MQWKHYQSKLKRRGAYSPVTVQAFSVSLGLLVFGAVAYWLFTSETLKAGVLAPRPSALNVTEWKKRLAGRLNVSNLEPGSVEIQSDRENIRWTVDFTLDEGLQRFIKTQLKNNRVDWGGVAVLDASTGEVLALASHSEKQPKSSNLALRATFPAASVFKMVTATAALEEKKYGRNSPVRFSSGIRRIRLRDLLRDGGSTSMTVAEAFAKSANSVFGKIGGRSLGGGLLQTYADRFGFNAEIPFEVPVESSLAKMPLEDPMEEANAAAGFTGATLSPLHGALLAAAALNDGVMMQPYVVKQVAAEGGRLFEAQPETWMKPMTAETAREMRLMMAKTVTEGTARAGYRRIWRDRALRGIDLGGKTGSLTGDNPKGKNEWFVGYARSAERKIALGIVIVSEKYWRIKPSRLSREIFDFYFSPRRQLEANAVSRGRPGS